MLGLPLAICFRVGGEAVTMTVFHKCRVIHERFPQVVMVGKLSAFVPDKLFHCRKVDIEQLQLVIYMDT
mgnify:CR=1 FL=1